MLGYPCLNIVDKNPAGSGTHRLSSAFFSVGLDRKDLEDQENSQMF